MRASEVFTKKKLENIDEKSKLTSYGFIRETQSLLPKHNTFYNIPLSITHIILVFYFEIDEFELFPDGFELSKDHRSVSAIKSIFWASAYGKTAIDSNEFFTQAATIGFSTIVSVEIT